MSRQPKHSRSRHKHQQSGVVIRKKYLPLIVVIVGLIVIGSALILIDREVAAVNPKVKGAPAIEVAQSYFDLGDVRFSQMARVTYQIRNVGDQPLKILEYPNVQVLEGC